MPALSNEAIRPARQHRWLQSAIKAASEPLPVLPFDRATRSRPASLTLTAPARPSSVAAR